MLANASPIGGISNYPDDARSLSYAAINERPLLHCAAQLYKLRVYGISWKPEDKIRRVVKNENVTAATIEVCDVDFILQKRPVEHERFPLVVIVLRTTSAHLDPEVTTWEGNVRAFAQTSIKSFNFRSAFGEKCGEHFDSHFFRDFVRDFMDANDG
jgi:hypothetical protein